MQTPTVMLLGSANVDLVIRTPRFPQPGETLTGTSFQTFAGGKGANQAVAVGKLGGQVGLIAKLGQDPFGDQLIQSLTESGVDTQWVLRDPQEATGVALITVDQNGQNTIVVAPGTNALLKEQELRPLKEINFKVLLAQLEIPLPIVEKAATLARHRTFILNPAPAKDLSADFLQKVDYLTPNETEAQILTGILPTDPASCEACAKKLLDKGVKNVLITLGANGSYLANPQRQKHFPSIQVHPVDTTGAGDAFNGAFAHFIATGEEVDRAIHLANVVGALSTTKPGAQASMPTLKEVLARA